MKRIRMAEDLTFSRMVHGLWRLADWNLSQDETLALMEECLDLGVTTFDHADIYGDYTSEALFGRALKLKPFLRDSMQIVTKCGIKLLSEKHPTHEVKYYDTSKVHIIQSAENSINNLHCENIDVLLIHRPDPYMNPEEVAEAFYQLKKEGKVRYFGVSNFSPSQFNMLSSYLDFPLVTNQVEISALYLEAFHDGTIEQCLERRISPMSWSPLAGGKIFTENDQQAIRVRHALIEVGRELEISAMDQLLFSWLLNHPARITPIIGSGNISRIRSAIEAISIKMTRQQWFKIWIASLGTDVP